MADEQPPDSAVTHPRPTDSELADTQAAPAVDATSKVARGTLAARTVGRFRIDATLGSGGMGDVYRAYDPVLDRDVALKVLRSNGSADDPQRLRRVIREARAAAALTHPNTVTIFEVGEAEHEVFIAMELLDGEDLRAVLDRGDAPREDQLRWLLDAARALDAAHERGLVHRDVKPENMFVCKGGLLKLLDFGIAKRDDEAAVASTGSDLGPSSLRTSEGRRVGTPRYMAPEQHAGDATDARTDEYAWGLVAFELLAGTHIAVEARTMTRDGPEAVAARTGEAPEAIEAQNTADDRLAMLRAKALDVPDPILRAIARALEPRKEDRYESMAKVIAAFDERAAPRPHRSRGRVVWLAVIGAALLAAAVGGARALRGARATSLPPACRVESTRSLTLGPDDRFAVMTDGALIVARDVRRGIVLDHETAIGTKPVLRSSMLSMLGKDIQEIEMHGVDYAGEPALFAIASGSASKMVLFGAYGLSSQVSKNVPVPAPITGHAVAPLGKGLLFVVTSSLNTTGQPTVPTTTLYHLDQDLRAVPQFVVEGGASTAPAIAVEGERVAVAYVTLSGIRFVFLDERLARMGDVQTVAPTRAIPAAAFAGASPAIFWTADADGKTRLTVSTFDPSNATLSAPRLAIDEPTRANAPLAMRLPDGRWTVAWVSAVGGRATLRVSPVGGGAVLTGPSDIVTSAKIEAVDATATADGIAYWWHESESLVRIARVTCR